MKPIQKIFLTLTADLLRQKIDLKILMIVEQ